MDRVPFIQHKYFTLDRMSEFLDLTCPQNPPECYNKSPKHPIRYLDLVASFDIESTSTTIDGKKTAFMYVWQFNLSGATMIGRTWDEFRELIAALVHRLKLDAPDDVIPHAGRVLAVYVHNLSFEFQFFRTLFSWLRIFALDSHKPIRACTLDGVEFRCSYVLSGLSLGKLEPRNGIRKAKGDLDYRRIRHQSTRLTEKEIGYCVDDVRVLSSWLSDKLEDNGDTIATVPMTRTGYVRRDMRYNCFKDKKYRDLMKSLKLKPEQYQRLKRAFQGGFTHANAHYAGRTLTDVHSKDITSSYPTVMVAEKFPMSAFRPYLIKDDADFQKQILSFCCLFEARFRNLRPRLDWENPISESKAIEILGSKQVNNGRIVSAEYLSIDLTEVDWEYIYKFYEWDEVKILNFERATKRYLPKAFVETILEYYEKKTKLKGVDGEEVMYAKHKEYVNAIYGMTVTDIFKLTWGFDFAQGWYNGFEDEDKQKAETRKHAAMIRAVEKNNDSKSRFLYYAWGVWTTAYARRNLFKAIEAVNEDYVYSDTDSAKYLNGDDHEDFFQAYNKEIVDKLEAACRHHGIDPARVRPLNDAGEECPLGVFDDEGTYRRFKTLGAKRYLVEAWDMKKQAWILKSTVAGVNKKSLPEYLQERRFFRSNGDGTFTRFYGIDPFAKFEDDLYIPESCTGKLTHTYIDEESEFQIRDYQGMVETVHTFGGVHLEAQSYEMSLAEIYLDYLLSLQGKKHLTESYY